MPLDRIWLCGDVHGDLRALHRALAQAVEPPLAVLLVGDLDPPQPVGDWLASIGDAGVETWFIHGNHETDSDLVFSNMFESPGHERNLHGRVQTIAGLRVAGLGGVFRSEVWYPPAEPSFEDYAALEMYWWYRTPRHQRSKRGTEDTATVIAGKRMRKHRTSIFPGPYATLASQRADVLIVHEAPSCHPHGFQAIDDLARGMGARWVAHGHHHDALDYRAYTQSLGFTAIGVGLRGITTLSGKQIVAGELDARRSRTRMPTGEGRDDVT